jgi:hypothetical protein
MIRPLTPLQAREWVAHMLRTESDALTYAWPRTDEMEAESVRLWELAAELSRGLARNTRDAAHRRWRGE